MAEAVVAKLLRRGMRREADVTTFSAAFIGWESRGRGRGNILARDTSIEPGQIM